MDENNNSAGSTKRRIVRDCDELSEQLSSLRTCLASFKEELYHILVTPLPEPSLSGTNGQAPTSSDRLQRTSALMDSSSRLFRSCLHTYNVLEGGLNYLDDPAKSKPEVIVTQRSVEDALEMLGRVLPQLGDATAESSVVDSFQDPLVMLHATLRAMLEDMEHPPTDPAVLPLQHEANLQRVRTRRE